MQTYVSNERLRNSVAQMIWVWFRTFIIMPRLGVSILSLNYKGERNL